MSLVINKHRVPMIWSTPAEIHPEVWECWDLSSAEFSFILPWAGLQALGAALGDKAGHIDKATSEVAGEVKTAAGQVGQATLSSSPATCMRLCCEQVCLLDSRRPGHTGSLHLTSMKVAMMASHLFAMYTSFGSH